MAKISLKKDYMDGNVLYGKDLNPNFETIETTINANDDTQAETNAEVEEALTQLSSDMTQAQTDIGELQEDVTNLESGITGGDSATLESAKSYTDTKLQDYAKTTDVPTKISQLKNDDNTVKDASYVHTDNNYSTEEKNKLAGLSNYELPVATSDTLGGIKLGNGVVMNAFNALGLAIASASQLGGIKAGDGVEIESDGTLNVTGGSSGDGIPTLVGTQENPICLYSINSGSNVNGVPIGLCIISGYAKELTTSEVTDKFNGNLCYTASNFTQFIGPDYDELKSNTIANLKFWFRPGLIQSGTSYFSQPFIEFTYNDIITNTEQGYVTPKAVYDYVGALASLSTEDKSSIVNAINELVNSSGTPGKDGLDYLGYYNVTNFMQEPYIGQTFTFQISNFSRTPVIGDTFIMLGKRSNTNSYLITCEVTDVKESRGTTSAKIVTFTETTGLQGQKGLTGDPGPAGADGVTPTIGENGNWYLGETDTGKPSRGGQGPKGDTGDQGPQGLPGPTGPGVPTGGTTGQILTKLGNGDYETAWKDVEGGGSGLIELVGTEDEPIDIRYLVEPGIYQIKGYVSHFPTGINVDKGSSKNTVVVSSSAFDTSYYPIMAFVNINLDKSSIRANRLFLREVSVNPILYSHIGNVNKDGSGKNYIDANTLDWMNLSSTSSGNLSTSNYLATGHCVSNMIATATGITPTNNLDDLQTTNKSSLIAAINELNTRLAALENPTE